MKPNFIFVLFLLAIMGQSIMAQSQEDSVNQNQYDGLSIQDLLSIKIVSVSKRSELLFDAALSASVVSREEIRRAGSTSIMEALKLVPGMIVREQSNGNYDIYLRGMDNVPPHAPFDGNSTTTLVMINNRPIYNYLKGGTFWETLPVDLNDVEKIEVVRGPAAALYGPNAVNGVINIITRQAEKKGLYLIANTQQGSYNTFINNASIGFNKGKWNMIASANYQGRGRTQATYYEFNRNQWFENPPYYMGLLGDTIRDRVNVKPEQAMKKYAGNAFVNYDDGKSTKLNFSAGVQQSMAQKVSTENGVTPLSTVWSTSGYADIRANIKDFTAQLSYVTGSQAPTYPGSTYDFRTIDASLEYNYILGNLSLKPGISYRSALYDDTKYTNEITKDGIFNAKGEVMTQTASLRSEYKMIDDRLKIIGAIAVNKFNYPDDIYLAYQLAATYKLNKKHLFRAVVSRSPKSTTIYDTYVNQVANHFPIGNNHSMMITVESNSNLKLLTADMMELGYRGNIAKDFYVDIELFKIHSSNYSSVVINPNYIRVTPTDTIHVTPIIPTNLPVKLNQHGMTVSLTYQSKVIQAKAFMTMQKSVVDNYAPFLNTPDASGPLVYNPSENNIYSGMGTSINNKSTPSVFGGASFNWAASSKFNVNLNSYYYTAQTYLHTSDIIFNDGVRGIDHLKAKFILNTKVSYQAAKGLLLYCSGKNLLNMHSREFYYSDRVPFMLMGGIHYEF
jgi:iron complex outermembrane receptor protein